MSPTRATGPAKAGPLHCALGLVFALGLMSTRPAQAQRGDSLDLAGALALARQRSPVLAAAGAAQASADGRLGSARSNRWPRLTAEGLYLRFQDPPGVALGALGGFAPLAENSYFLQLGIQQPLYTGGRVSGAVRTAEWGSRAAAASRAQAEVELTAAVAHAHDAVLLAQALLGVAQEGEAVLDSATTVARDRLADGTASRLDVLRAQTRLALAQAEVRAARAGLASTREQLAALIGLDAAAAPPVAGRLEPAAVTLDSAAVRALLDQARSARPDLESLEAGARAAEARAGTARASLRPAASVGLYGLVTRPELVTARQDWTGKVYGTVVVRWPIFDFGAAAGEAAAAHADAERLRAEARGVADDASAGVLARVRDLARAAEDIVAGRENVERAERAVALAQARYEEGVGIQLDVLEAESDLVRTRADLLRAIHAQRSAIVELRRVTGRPADGPLPTSATGQ